MVEKYYSEQLADIYCGHAIEVLKALPDESIQMAITSPPYWGLRAYSGGSDIVWGGDLDCEHVWGNEVKAGGRAGQPWDTKSVKIDYLNFQDGSTKTNFCLKCSSWRGQLGLEPTPELYVSHLMMIFCEVKRVLKKTGSFYLNIGDTFSATRSYQVAQSKWQSSEQGVAGVPMKATGEPKCMVCIPERVMFAMIEDGWILRNKNIWHKSNSMPGSQKDRLTCSWEYLYFFVKNSTTILWRNEQTGEWQDTEPTKEEKYPLGGRYRNFNTGEVVWGKPKDTAEWEHLTPVWHGFDYYFDLDQVRVPHKTQSLERYQRQVNFGDRTPQSKYADTNPYPEGTQPIYREGRNLCPDWFKEMFPEDKDYKGKFDQMFESGSNTGEHNKEPYEVNNPHRMRLEKAKEADLGKHHDSSHDGRGGFDREARDRPLVAPHHPYRGDGWEKQAIEGREPKTKHDIAVGRTGNVSYTDPLHTKDYSPKGKNPSDVIETRDTPQKPPHHAARFRESDFGAEATGETAGFHPLGKNPGDILTARQENIVGHFEQKGSGGHYLYGGIESPEGVHEHRLGKNPSDFWEITTQPSSISVCPECETVFKRVIKVCPQCGHKGVTGHFACVDEETECLTTEGWKRYYEFKMGERIATYNLQKQLIEFYPLQQVHTYNFDGEILQIGKRDLKILCTQNHRTVVVPRRCRYPKIVAAMAINKYDRIPTIAPFNNFPERSSIGKEMARLLGWVFSEGHLRQPGLSIYQNDGLKAKEIEVLINALSIPYSKSLRRGNQVCFYLKKRSVEKEVVQRKGNLGYYSRYKLHPIVKLLKELAISPVDIISLPQEELTEFFDAFMSGDGNWRRDSRGSFKQRDSWKANVIQIVAMRLGYRCNLSKDKSLPLYCGFLTHRNLIGIRGTNGKNTSIQLVPYKGVVWCPQTVNSTWVARRDGRPFITGNSYPEALCETPISASSRPGDTILDPFCGGGTTGVVAKRLGRKSILIDVVKEYCIMAKHRISKVEYQPEMELK